MTATPAAGLAYLSLGGVEVANIERLRAYLATPANVPVTLQVTPQSVCTAIVNVENGGVSYGASPSVDAPWYSASRPESGDYLGFAVSSATWERDIDVPSVERVTLGASLGRPRRKASVLHVVGMLLAKSCQGREYGLRWLRAAVAAGCDASCAGGTVRYRKACPPAGYADTWGVYSGFNVVATTTPHVTGEPENGCCDWAQVEFELTFPSVDVWEDATTLFTGSLYTALPGACIDPCVWLTDQPAVLSASLAGGSIGAAGVVTITTGADELVGVSVWAGGGLYPAATLYPSDCLYPAASGVAEPLPQSCPAVFTFDYIPPNTTVVVDGARRSVYIVASDGTLTDASSLLLGGSTLPAWPVADCGETVAVSVGVSAYCAGGDDATVTIQSRARS